MKIDENNLNTFIDLLESEWEKDSVINIKDLIEAEIETARLHAKYINYSTKAKRLLAQLEYDFNILRGKKSRYYRGKLSKKELDLENWKPFQYVLKTKGEIDEVMSFDDDINKVAKLIALTNSIIEMCDSCLYNIRQRTFQIKNIIEIKKFEAGI